MAPRGMCGSAPARAARSLPQRSPCGTRVGGTMYPRQARLRLHAAVPPRGSRSANRCFRDLLTAFARPCRCPLPAAFCAESAAPAPPAAKAPGCRGSRQRREIILSGLGDFRQHQRARLHAGSAHIGCAVNLGSLKPDPADMQTGHSPCGASTRISRRSPSYPPRISSLISCCSAMISSRRARRASFRNLTGMAAAGVPSSAHRKIPRDGGSGCVPQTQPVCRNGRPFLREIP